MRIKKTHTEVVVYVDNDDNVTSNVTYDEVKEIYMSDNPLMIRLIERFIEYGGQYTNYFHTPRHMYINTIENNGNDNIVFEFENGYFVTFGSNGEIVFWTTD